MGIGTWQLTDGERFLKDNDPDTVPVHGADSLATANVDLSAPGASVGGLAMGAGQTFVCVAQTAGPENGKYTWTGAATPATRSEDFSLATQWRIGVKFFIRDGTHIGQTWVLTDMTTNPPVIGTDSVLIEQDLGASPLYRFVNRPADQTPDDVEDTFTFGPPWAGAISPEIYVNGVQQLLGGGDDYTMGGGGEVVFNTPPPTGAKLWANFNSLEST